VEQASNGIYPVARGRYYNYNYFCSIFNFLFYFHVFHFDLGDELWPETRETKFRTSFAFRYTWLDRRTAEVGDACSAAT